MPIQLPHPSTLASKWCTLVFPQEFLERYQTQSNSTGEDDLGLALDEGRSLRNKKSPKPFSVSDTNLNQSNYDKISPHYRPTRDENLYASSSLYDTINYAAAPLRPIEHQLNPRLPPFKPSNESKFELYLVKDQNEETDDDDAQTICNRQPSYALESASSSPSSNSIDLLNNFTVNSSSIRNLNSTYDSLLNQFNYSKIGLSMSRSNSELPGSKINNPTILHGTSYGPQFNQSLPGLSRNVYVSNREPSNRESQNRDDDNSSASCDDLIDSKLSHSNVQ